MRILLGPGSPRHFKVINVTIVSIHLIVRLPSRFLKSAGRSLNPTPIIPKPPACASINDVATGVPISSLMSLAASSVSPWPHGLPGSTISLPVNVKNTVVYLTKHIDRFFLRVIIRFSSQNNVSTLTPLSEMSARWIDRKPCLIFNCAQLDDF